MCGGGARRHGRTFNVPKKFPPEFERDVVTVVFLVCSTTSTFAYE